MDIARLVPIVGKQLCCWSLALAMSWVPFSSAYARSKTELRVPQLYLWAWQRDEDLSWINPQQFGIAYLACRVVLSGDCAKPEWRQQRLKMPVEATLIPVIRIDVDSRRLPVLDSGQVEKTADIVLRAAELPRSSAVQIDFDALLSQREFYRKLLETIHQRLNNRIPLSITALASWCLYDNWIKNLPVDETVPMMFSLGAERKKVLARFERGDDFLVSGCCNSLGLSLNDSEVNTLMIPVTKKRTIPVRIYVFTRSAWTREKVKALQSMVGLQ